MSAGVTIYTLQTTDVQLVSTEMNSLASGTYVLASVGGSSGKFNNSVQTINGVAATANLGGYLRAKLWLVLGSFGSLPAVGGTINLWFLHGTDSLAVESGSSSIVPARPPDVQIPVIAQTAAQNVVMDIKLPAGLWTPLVANNTGQPLNGTGNAIAVQAYTAGE